VKSRERFMGIGQLMTMPLFFASNAIYPLELMPRWLKMVALFNPYLVDALRGLMIRGGQSLHSFRWISQSRGASSSFWRRSRRGSIQRWFNNEGALISATTSGGTRSCSIEIMRY